MNELKSEFLFELSATLNTDSHQIGDGGHGTRRIIEVTGGSFEGPHLRGEVLPFGADFLAVRSDGVAELDVRIILRTDDGAEIYMTYLGLSHTQSLGPYGEIPEGERYFRTTPRFETGAEQYQWLNRIFAVGVGQQAPPGSVRYLVYAIL